MDSVDLWICGACGPRGLLVDLKKRAGSVGLATDCSRGSRGSLEEGSSVGRATDYPRGSQETNSSVGRATDCSPRFGDSSREDRV